MSIRIIIALAFCAFIATTATAQSAKKPLRAAGQVEAVSQESLTVLLPGNSKITLVVDKDTKLTGRARGGKTNATEGTPNLDGIIKPSDSVVVTYSDDGGKLRATEIHVRSIAK